MENNIDEKYEEATNSYGEAIIHATELYDILFSIDAPEGFLDDVDRIIYWLENNGEEL